MAFSKIAGLSVALLLMGGGVAMAQEAACACCERMSDENDMACCEDMASGDAANEESCCDDQASTDQADGAEGADAHAGHGDMGSGAQ